MHYNHPVPMRFLIPHLFGGVISAKENYYLGEIRLEQKKKKRDVFCIVFLSRIVSA